MPYLTSATPCPEPLDCRILTAALELFVAKGYHSVSIHEIQKRADVSIGSIYNHFGGKEGVASALYQHLLNELHACIDQVQQSSTSPWQQCRELIRRLFDYTDSHRDIMAFLFHCKHADFLPDAEPLLQSPPFQEVRGIIANSMKQNEIRSQDMNVCMAAVFGATEKMIQLRLDNVIEQPLSEHLDATLATIEAGLLPEENLTTQSRPDSTAASR